MIAGYWPGNYWLSYWPSLYWPAAPQPVPPTPPAPLPASPYIQQSVGIDGPSGNFKSKERYRAQKDPEPFPMSRREKKLGFRPRRMGNPFPKNGPFKPFK